MAWFSGFRRKALLEPAWEYGTSGVIWRLLASPSGFLVGEERDLAAKSVSFFCLERERGTIQWSGRRVGRELWWVSLNAIHEEIVFLHEYATPTMPDQKKIYALGLPDGEMLWASEELTYLFADGASVYASKDRYDDRQFFELEAGTGRIVREVDAAMLNLIRERTLSPGGAEPAAGLEFPDIGDPGADPALRRALAALGLAGERVGLTEWLEKREFLVLSAYEDTKAVPAAQQSFRQHLAIVEKEGGEVRFRARLAENAPAAVPDTFFGWADFVYYIQDKKLLRAINLSPAYLP